MNAKSRISALISFADDASRAAVKSAGTGVITLKSEPTMDQLEKTAQKLDGADKQSKIKSGLLSDVAQIQAASSIVKLNGKEMSGADWFNGLNEKRKTENKKALTLGRDFRREFAALKSKNDGKNVVKNGIEFALPKCLTTSGKKGRTKADPMAYLNDLL